MGAQRECLGVVRRDGVEPQGGELPVPGGDRRPRDAQVHRRRPSGIRGHHPVGGPLRVGDAAGEGEDVEQRDVELDSKVRRPGAELGGAAHHALGRGQRAPHRGPAGRGQQQLRSPGTVPGAGVQVGGEDAVVAVEVRVRGLDRGGGAPSQLGLHRG